jgi:PTS system nitrogen regulatory IIA component
MEDQTMNLGDILANDGIIPALEASDKKHALQQLAERAAEATGLDSHSIFTALLQRERLSSTSLGRGIAIPHIKMSGLTSITCFFAKLSTPLSFDSHDGEPVDLLFVLLAPEHAGGDHLKALARISRLVRDPATLEHLRAAKDADSLRHVLTSPLTSHAA